eukprot:337871_1
MITPLHDKFELYISPSEFIEKCDNILKQNNEDRVEFQAEPVALINIKPPNDRLKAARKYNKSNKIQFLELSIIIIISIVALVLAALINSDNDNGDCVVNIKQTKVYISTAMSASILIAIICIYFQTFKGNMVRGLRVVLFVRAILFSLHLSGIGVYLYNLHF